MTLWHLLEARLHVGLVLSKCASVFESDIASIGCRCRRAWARIRQTVTVWAAVTRTRIRWGWLPSRVRVRPRSPCTLATTEMVTVRTLRDSKCRAGPAENIRRRDLAAGSMMFRAAARPRRRQGSRPDSRGATGPPGSESLSCHDSVLRAAEWDLASKPSETVPERPRWSIGARERRGEGARGCGSTAMLCLCGGTELCPTML